MHSFFPAAAQAAQPPEPVRTQCSVSKLTNLAKKKKTQQKKPHHTKKSPFMF